MMAGNLLERMFEACRTEALRRNWCGGSAVAKQSAGQRARHKQADDSTLRAVANQRTV